MLFLFYFFASSYTNQMEPKCFSFHFSCFYQMESYFLTFFVEILYSEMRKKKILQKTKEDGRLTKMNMR